MEEKKPRGRPRKDVSPKDTFSGMLLSIMEDCRTMMTNLRKAKEFFNANINDSTNHPMVTEICNDFWKIVRVKKSLYILREYSDLAGTPILMMKDDGTVITASENAKLRALIRRIEQENKHPKLTEEDMI